jgi:epidermal growth factor receptor substrate 15
LISLWPRTLADIRQCGYLDETEFIIAMHYIAKCMDKSITTLPSILPTDVYLVASNGTMSPTRTSFVTSPLLKARAEKIDTIGNIAFASDRTSSNTVWDITAHEKAQYDTYFAKLDKQRTGVVQGTDAVDFFKNSKLPETDLAKIWDLADMGKKGYLNANEFAVAMHLIHRRLTGGAVPHMLPKSLIPPPTPTAIPTSPLSPTGASFHSVDPTRGSGTNHQRGITMLSISLSTLINPPIQQVWMKTY